MGAAGAAPARKGAGMKARIICGAGVFSLEPDGRDPAMVVVSSDYDGVLRRVAGDAASISSRGKTYRTRVPKADVGALVMGVLER